MTKARRFTVHRMNGWNIVVGVFVFLIAVETAALHMLLTSWISATVAWIATALSASSVIWLVRDAAALHRGGVFVRANEIELRIGRRWHAFVLRDAIASVEYGPAADDDRDVVDLSILGANTVLRFNRPVRLRGPFRRTRDARAIALSLDDRDGFLTALTSDRLCSAA